MADLPGTANELALALDAVANRVETADWPDSERDDRLWQMAVLERSAELLREADTIRLGHAARRLAELMDERLRQGVAVLRVALTYVEAGDAHMAATQAMLAAHHFAAVGGMDTAQRELLTDDA
jgi:hypothetical protein